MFGHLNHGKPELDGSVTITTAAGADIVEFPAGAVITAGDVVMIQLNGSVVQSTGAMSSKAVGVALESVTALAAAAGATVRVCIAGGIVGVNGAAGLNDGDPLLASTGTAGQVDAWGGASTRPPVGVALTATAGVPGPVTVYWYRKA